MFLKNTLVETAKEYKTSFEKVEMALHNKPVNVATNLTDQKKVITYIVSIKARTFRFLAILATFFTKICSF